MDEYRNTMREKRSQLYAKLRDLWYGDKRNVYFDGLEDLMATIYYDVESLQKLQVDPNVMAAASFLLQLKTQYEIKIKQLYDLLKMDNLYTALSWAEIDHGYFICCVFLYVWGHAGFNTDEFYSKTCRWSGDTEDSDGSQNLFNTMSRDIVKRLDVFYIA